MRRPFGRRRNRLAPGEVAVQFVCHECGEVELTLPSDLTATQICCDTALLDAVDLEARVVHDLTHLATA